MVLHWVGGKGENDGDVLPILTDYFSSIYVRDQNILFFVRLNLKCGIFQVLLRGQGCYSSDLVV
jgi:hypothetical protein